MTEQRIKLIEFLRTLFMRVGQPRPSEEAIQRLATDHPSGAWVALANGIVVVGDFTLRAGVWWFLRMDGDRNLGRAAYDEIEAWRFLPLDNNLKPIEADSLDRRQHLAN